MQCATATGIFFFFQAEDGIRDRNVTGVQTCALPILKIQAGRSREAPASCLPGSLSTRSWLAAPRVRSESSWKRSEERRVGKEWRSRWWAYREKKKERRRQYQRYDEMYRMPVK